MKRLVCVLLVAIVFSALNAAPVVVSTARQVAVQYYIAHGGNPESAYNFVNQSQLLGLSNVYLFVGPEDRGFVLVSADDCVQPILGCSLVGTFGFPVKPSVAAWLSDYDNQISTIKATSGLTPSQVANQWKQLLKPSKTGDSYSMVGPLLHTTWSQSPLYNEMCPIKGDERCVTGCVATAMAQIMRYWSSPSVASGYHSYRHPSLGTISASFGSFDWQNMPLSLSNSSTQQQVDAVAKLMFHCGVSVEMDYDVSRAGGSSAYASDVVDALVDYFDYSPEIKHNSKSNFTDSAWSVLLKNDIDAGRPILYSGSGSGGGHAFVCDGYDSDGLFHFNWGWGGMYDGMFAIGSLQPGSGGIGSNRDNKYNNNNTAITNIEPNYSAIIVSPNPLHMSCWGGEAHVMIRSSNQSDDAWVIENTEDWLTFSDTTGLGSGNLTDITITASHNTSAAARSTTVMIRQGSLQSSLLIYQPDGTVANPGCYGNQDPSGSISLLKANYAMVIRPEAYGNFDTTHQLNKVCFETADITYMNPAVQGRRFSIEIYENCVFSDVLENNEIAANMSDLLGTKVYSQNYTALSDGLHEVVLDVPYRISTKTFWIVVRCLEYTGFVSNDFNSISTGAYLKIGLATTSAGSVIDVIYPFSYGNDEGVDSRPLFYFCTETIDTPPTPPQQDSCQTVYEPLTTVAACSDYLWRDTLLTQSGRYTKLAEATVTGGCDTVFTIDFNRIVPSQVTDSTISCGDFTWRNGITYTQSGIYSDTVLNASGECDSVYQLYLFVQDVYTDTLTIADCKGYYWSDSLITTDGIYSYNAEGIGEEVCDSIHTLVYSRLDSEYDSAVVSSCSDYQWFDRLLTSTGLYYHRIESVVETICDSSFVLSFTHVEQWHDSVAISTCLNYSWFDSLVTSSGVYSHVVEAQDLSACDSLFTLRFTKLGPVIDTSNVALCFDYQWYDTTITTDGVYSKFVASASESVCDSLHILDYLKLQPYHIFDTISTCDMSLLFDGETFYADTLVSRQFTALNQCDSLVETSLFVAHNSDTTLYLTGCDSVIFAHQAYKTSGLRSGVILQNRFHCDSLIKIDVTILNSSPLVYADTTVCDAVYFNRKRFAHDTSGVEVVVPNSVGCDSVISMSVRINRSTFAIDSVSVCDSFVWHGQMYCQSVDWPLMDTVDANGCDSIRGLCLTIRNSSNHYDTLQACDSLIWYDTIYHESGEYKHPLSVKNSIDCDSIDNLILTIRPKTYSDTEAYSCDSLVWNGRVYYQSVTGNTQTYTDQHGCDSIVRLRLVVSYTSRSHEYAEACGYFRWQGHAVSEDSLNENREFFDTIQNQYGCDSVLVLHLTTYPQGTGALNGVFEVADGRRVSFSMGNLQYWPSNAMWRFAVRQYDFAGAANSGAAANYNAWIDLFGWGTSGYHAPNDLNNRFYMPYSIESRNISVPNNTNGYGPSIDRDDLNLTGKSSNYDWGIYNAITNGGNNPGQWRLLTNDEWQYLFCYRRHAVDKYAMATVGTYRGLVVLPESWILPAGCTYQSGCNNGYLTNVYSPAQWSDMEDAGALFLPAAGARYDTTVSSIAQNGYYWSSTYYDQNNAYLLLLESGRVSTGGYNRSVGRSVRLVQNVDGETLPCETYGDTTITAIDSLVWFSNTYYTSGDYERRLIKSNHMACDSVVVLHLTIRSALGVDAPKGHETIGVRAAKGSIIVDGAANRSIKVYDVTGRVVASDVSASQHTTFQVPSVGAYIVKISDRPSQKVVVTSR